MRPPDKLHRVNGFEAIVALTTAMRGGPSPTQALEYLADCGYYLGVEDRGYVTPSGAGEAADDEIETPIRFVPGLEAHPQRKASGAGEGVGSERDSSRAEDYRRPSARREEGTE